MKEVERLGFYLSLVLLAPNNRFGIGANHTPEISGVISVRGQWSCYSKFPLQAFSAKAIFIANLLESLSGKIDSSSLFSDCIGDAAIHC